MYKNGQQLTNLIDIIGFIYNPDTLPSAVVSFSDGAPACVHGLRDGPDSMLRSLWKLEASGNDAGTEATNVIKVYPDYKAAVRDRHQGHICTGCAVYNPTNPERHLISKNEQHCKKLQEECA
jgi:hypothetical protein